MSDVTTVAHEVQSVPTPARRRARWGYPELTSEQLDARARELTAEALLLRRRAPGESKDYPDQKGLDALVVEAVAGEACGQVATNLLEALETELWCLAALCEYTKKADPHNETGELSSVFDEVAKALLRMSVRCGAAGELDRKIARATDLAAELNDEQADRGKQ